MHEGMVMHEGMRAWELERGSEQQQAEHGPECSSRPSTVLGHESTAAAPNNSAWCALLAMQCGTVPCSAQGHTWSTSAS